MRTRLIMLVCAVALAGCGSDMPARSGNYSVTWTYLDAATQPMPLDIDGAPMATRAQIVMQSEAVGAHGGMLLTDDKDVDVTLMVQATSDGVLVPAWSDGLMPPTWTVADTTLVPDGDGWSADVVATRTQDGQQYHWHLLLTRK